MWIKVGFVVAVALTAIEGNKKGDVTRAVIAWDGVSLPVVSYQYINQVCTDKLAQLEKSSDNSAEKRIYLERRALASFYSWRMEGAYDDFQRCFRLDSNDLKMRFAFARCAAILKRRQEALDVANDLIKNRSTAHLGYCVLGIVHYANSQWSEADKAMTEAIARKPQWAEPYAWRGRCRLRAGKWQASVDDMLDAMSCPEAALFDMVRCRIVLAVALGKLGKEAAAVGNLRLLMRMRPEEGVFQDALWGYLAWIREYEEALAVARIHTGMAPRDSLGWSHLALSLSQFGRLDEAIEAARKAVDLDPLGRNAWGTLARVQLLRGEYGHANISFRQLVKLVREARDGPRVGHQDAVRLVLFLAACPQFPLRNGLQAKRLSYKLALPEKSEPRRIILLLRACATAEARDTKQAAKLVEEAIDLGGSTKVELVRLKKLHKLFSSGHAYEHDWTCVDKQLLRIDPAEIVGVAWFPFLKWSMVDNLKGEHEQDFVDVVVTAAFRSKENRSKDIQGTSKGRDGTR